MLLWSVRIWPPLSVSSWDLYRGARGHLYSLQFHRPLCAINIDCKYLTCTKNSSTSKRANVVESLLNLKLTFRMDFTSLQTYMFSRAGTALSNESDYNQIPRLFSYFVEIIAKQQMVKSCESTLPLNIILIAMFLYKVEKHATMYNVCFCVHCRTTERHKVSLTMPIPLWSSSVSVISSICKTPSWAWSPQKREKEPFTICMGEILPWFSSWMILYLLSSQFNININISWKHTHLWTFKFVGSRYSLDSTFCRGSLWSKDWSWKLESLEMMVHL